MSAPARSRAQTAELLQEQRYQRQFVAVDRKPAAAVLAVLCVAHLIAIRNDVRLLESAPTLLYVVLVVKVIHLVGTIAVLVRLRRAKSPRQQNTLVAGGLVLVALAFTITSLTRYPSGELQGPLIATLCITGVMFLAMRGPLWARALASLGPTAANLVLLFNPRAVISPAGRLTGGIALVSLNVIGFVAARAFEENRRKRFEAERLLAVKVRELAAEKERAEAASRARSAFLAAMSHEFRTPMNAVIGLSDVLLEAPLAPEHHEHVRTISESARALLVQLNDILDFAKIDAQSVSLSPAPLDLIALTRSVVHMLRPAAKAKSIELTHDIAPSVPRHVVSDEARLRQVLVNLVSNAIKFTDRGSVRLRASAKPLDGGEHDVSFRIEDTGIGMTSDVIARLFKPFEQADVGIARRFGGTGLGLAISKQIVVAMGGDVEVESQPGRGSVFSFTLRLVAAAPPAKAPLPATPAANAERPALAILVVDDQPINLDVARLRFKRLGYPVDVASGGPAAIEAASTKAYDVIFMDLQMPEMSGIEATRRILKKLAGANAPRVVAMTASVFEEDRAACRAAGMRDFVGKPIDLEQLDAVLRRVADERSTPPSPSPSSEPPASSR